MIPSKDELFVFQIRTVLMSLLNSKRMRAYIKRPGYRLCKVSLTKAVIVRMFKSISDDRIALQYVLLISLMRSVAMRSYLNKNTASIKNPEYRTTITCPDCKKTVKIVFTKNSLSRIAYDKSKKTKIANA